MRRFPFKEYLTLAPFNASTVWLSWKIPFYFHLFLHFLIFLSYTFFCYCFRVKPNGPSKMRCWWEAVCGYLAGPNRRAGMWAYWGGYASRRMPGPRPAATPVQHSRFMSKVLFFRRVGENQNMGRSETPHKSINRHQSHLPFSSDAQVFAVLLVVPATHTKPQPPSSSPATEWKASEVSVSRGP